MPRNYKMHVWEVQRAPQAILDFTDGKTLADYCTDQMLMATVERQISKIGGATRRLADDDKAIAKQITGYQAIIGFRNRIIHEYDNIANHTVWSVIQNNLPTLLKEVTFLLDKH